ncbi:MAG: hypothetical protein JWN52_4308 [Actinomycetia bacterium]|nr:hypothetical protein [Actinomycetes bacterium]
MYDLKAVIGGAELLQGVAGNLVGVRPVPLRQGLSLIPLTNELFDTVSDGSTTGPLGFWRLPGGSDRVLATWSESGALAYVEAEYFGGVGEQRAAVWAGGQLVLGPVQVAEGEPFPAAGSPISQALRRLGVRAEDTVDEFTAVGLQQHRHSRDWLSSL